MREDGDGDGERKGDEREGGVKGVRWDKGREESREGERGKKRWEIGGEKRRWGREQQHGQDVLLSPEPSDENPPKV